MALGIPAARPAKVAAILLVCAATPHAQISPFAGPVSTGSSVVITPFREAGIPDRPGGPATGRVHLHPHFLVRVLRGDGFALAALPEQDTTILTTEPGLLARIGRHWRADYTATWNRYSNPAFTDTFDSALVLAGEHEPGLWRLREQARMETSTSLLIETAAQTRTRRRGLNLELERDLGRGNLFDAGLDHTRTRVETVGLSILPVTPRWTETAARLRLTRRLAPDLHGSAFAHAGASAALETDSRQVRPGLGLRWRLGDRLQLGAEYSREWRRFRIEPRVLLQSDVVGARAEYSPWSATRLTLEAGRTLTPSFVAGEVTRQQLLRANLQQRLIGRLQFNAGILQRHQDSLPATGVGHLARTDRSRAIDLSVSCALLRRLNVSLLHRSTRNDSSLPGLAFRSRQFGVETHARF